MTAAGRNDTRDDRFINVSQSLAGARVLLAEDSPDNQRLLAYVLRKAGAEFTLVDNGSAVLDAINSAAPDFQHYDVILMDMQMPIMDGYQATRALRARGYRGAVVALTAHAMAADLEQCIRAGCDEVITKPIDRASFLAAIKKYYSRSRDAAPVSSAR